jgi:hypothetical protein
MVKLKQAEEKTKQMKMYDGSRLMYELLSSSMTKSEVARTNAKDYLQLRQANLVEVKLSPSHGGKGEFDRFWQQEAPNDAATKFDKLTLELRKLSESKSEAEVQSTCKGLREFLGKDRVLHDTNMSCVLNQLKPDLTMTKCDERFASCHRATLDRAQV